MIDGSMECVMMGITCACFIFAYWKYMFRPIREPCPLTSFNGRFANGKGFYKHAKSLSWVLIRGEMILSTGKFVRAETWRQSPQCSILFDRATCPRLDCAATDNKQILCHITDIASSKEQPEYKPRCLWPAKGATSDTIPRGSCYYW